MKIKKGIYLSVLIVFLLLGSFITYFATNLFLNNISSLNSLESKFFAAIPMLMIAVSFVLATLGVYRLYMHPEFKKKIIQRYTIVIACLAAIGAVFAFYSGLVVYKDFFSDEIFTNYPFIMLFNTMFIAGLSVYGRLTADKLEDDKEEEPKDFLPKAYPVFVGIILYYAMNKFGAVMWMVKFCEWETLYMTFPVYLSLILPAAILICIALKRMEIIKKSKLTSLILLGLAVILLVVNIIIIFGNPTLATALTFTSPFDIEKDTIVRAALVLGLSGDFVIREYKQ